MYTVEIDYFKSFEDETLVALMRAEPTILNRPPTRRERVGAACELEDRYVEDRLHTKAFDHNEVFRLAQDTILGRTP